MVQKYFASSKITIDISNWIDSGRFWIATTKKFAESKIMINRFSLSFEFSVPVNGTGQNLL